MAKLYRQHVLKEARVAGSSDRSDQVEDVQAAARGYARGFWRLTSRNSQMMKAASFQPGGLQSFLPTSAPLHSLISDNGEVQRALTLATYSLIYIGHCSQDRHWQMNFVGSSLSLHKVLEHQVERKVCAPFSQQSLDASVPPLSQVLT